MKFNSIEQAIADIKLGKVVIVVDDESRENEGDFVAAAEMATSEMVNFMATHGRGLICVPLVEDRCEQLGLDLMIGKNSWCIQVASFPRGSSLFESRSSTKRRLSGQLNSHVAMPRWPSVSRLPIS